MDLFAACLDRILATLAVEEDRVLLGDGDRTGRPEEIKGRTLELDVELVSEDGAAGEDSEVAKNWLAFVAEPGCFDSCDAKLVTQLVEDAGCECLTVDSLCDNRKRATYLSSSLERGQNVLE